jgi:CARDB
MRRFVLVAVIVLAAAPAAAQPTADPYLRSFVCKPSLDPSQRTVSVTAVMPTMSGTQKLEMRFQLESFAAGQATAIHGGDLGHWITPHPLTLGQQPADVWIVRHPVTGLTVPAVYHFKVTFRWIGAAGQILGTATRIGPNCRQPDLRPDLLVQSITVQPTPSVANTDDYFAVIGNSGLTPATDVEVLFRPGGTAAPQSVTVARLRPHSTHTVEFTGPLCTAARPPTITVDPNDLIDVSSRASSSMTATCPASAAAGARRAKLELR